MQEGDSRDIIKKIGNTTIRISDLYIARTPEAVAAILERIKRNAQLAISAEENNLQTQK